MYTDDVEKWAKKHNFQFHPGSEELFTEGAMSFNCFSRESISWSHVTGEYKNHPFEMIDIKSESSGVNNISNSSKRTVAVFPDLATVVPNCVFYVGRAQSAMAMFGIEGMEISCDSSASSLEKKLTQSFSQNYMIMSTVKDVYFSKGALDKFFAQLKGICKANVLQYLVDHPGYSMEFKNGGLQVNFGIGILSEVQRIELLDFVVQFLDELQNAEQKPVITGLTMQNNMKPKKIFGTIIGGVAGFMLGCTIGTIVFFTQRNLFFLFFICPLIGMILGSKIGKKIGEKL